jgi:hypothetical protein
MANTGLEFFCNPQFQMVSSGESRNVILHENNTKTNASLMILIGVNQDTKKYSSDFKSLEANN